ncbi:TonB-dependent receptor [soil metagenome]
MTLSIRLSLLASASLLVLANASPSLAQTSDPDPTQLEEVIVTGSLRGATNLQDTPLNIAAIGAQQIEAQGLTDIAEIARYVPGVYVVDQGPRNGSRIVVRGLNVDPLGESAGQDAGGTVATYIGNVPISVDLKLNDVQRVEFLLGPQGTLYGAGTLAGAIRYIPNGPSFSAPTLSIRGDGYGYSEGDGISTDFGLTGNLPITDTLAFRLSLDQLNDKGSVDQPFVVDQVGVTNPNVFTGSGLHREKDVNTEDVLSGRAALRWQPTSWFDATLSYNYQKSDVGGRQESGRRVSTFPIPVGDYEAVQRIEEPNTRTSDLVALEASIDLGFADLISATGYQTFKEDGRRDQTDLLISLQYSYEAFPGFTAYTRELDDADTLTQELRLTSKPDAPGPLSWIVGGFYSRLNDTNSSSEFTPGYPGFLGGSRPDNLEYYSISTGKVTETAVFGELTWKLTNAWQVTGGVRRYTYKFDTASATDLPLSRTVFNGDDPNSLILDFESSSVSEDGFLYKLNTSYTLSDDILLYGTISDGFRSGGSNNLTACTGPNSGQTVCAQPDELIYGSEKTRNYEIGAKTQWLDKRLTVNGDVFYIDWTDPQVASATLVGLSPITKNGSGARTYGAEVNFNAQVTSRFSLRGSLSYTKAELTDLAPRLITTITPPGFDTSYVDGQSGDRLPGSPEYQASLYANYAQPLSNGMTVDYGYGISASGDVLTRTGGRGGGITLPSYQIHNATVRLSSPGADWSVTAYVNNVWNEFAETGARGTPLSNQILTNGDGGPVYARTFFTNVLPPRMFGIRFTKDFL